MEELNAAVAILLGHVKLVFERVTGIAAPQGHGADCEFARHGGRMSGCLRSRSGCGMGDDGRHDYVERESMPIENRTWNVEWENKSALERQLQPNTSLETAKLAGRTGRSCERRDSYVAVDGWIDRGSQVEFGELGCV